jgi:hypothetical protein
MQVSECLHRNGHQILYDESNISLPSENLKIRSRKDTNLRTCWKFFSSVYPKKPSLASGIRRLEEFAEEDTAGVSSGLEFDMVVDIRDGTT